MLSSLLIDLRNWSLPGTSYFRPAPGETGLSGRRDVGCLQTLGPFRHLEFHLGAFIQGTVALRLNGREVYEHIFSVLPLDKAIALGCIEPLHCAFFFHLRIFLLYSLQNLHSNLI